MDQAAMSFILTDDRQLVDCASSLVGKTAVIVSAGQSLMGNSGDPSGRIALQLGVFNLNWIDGKCYVAKDPLLGATTAGANQLAHRGAFSQAQILRRGYGRTARPRWHFHKRLGAGRQYEQAPYRRLAACAEAGLSPTMILWQQGEAEAGNLPQPPNGKAWADLFNAMVISIRDIHVIAPIYDARSTICRNDGSTIIRNAQADVVNNFDVLPGPDTDMISLSDRWDGCHFGVSGLERSSRLWLAAITK